MERKTVRRGSFAMEYRRTHLTLGGNVLAATPTRPAEPEIPDPQPDTAPEKSPQPPRPEIPPVNLPGPEIPDPARQPEPDLPGPEVPDPGPPSGPTPTTA